MEKGYTGTRERVKQINDHWLRMFQEIKKDIAAQHDLMGRDENLREQRGEILRNRSWRTGYELEDKIYQLNTLIHEGIQEELWRRGEKKLQHYYEEARDLLMDLSTPYPSEEYDYAKEKMNQLQLPQQSKVTYYPSKPQTWYEMVQEERDAFARSQNVRGLRKQCILI